MKNSVIFIALTLTTFFTAHSQGFDYQETSYEIGIDIIPIFGGGNPYSLFLRKNYQTENGKTLAWRGTIRGSNTNMYSEHQVHQNFDRVAYHNVGFSIGKEFQQIVTERIIVYSGLDLGFDYSSRRFSNDVPPSDTDGILSVKDHTFGYLATVFSGVKYHLTPRFSVFAEFGIEGSFSRDMNVVRRGAFNFDAGRDRTLNRETTNYRIIPLRSIRLAYHF
jgi:hypothetical protein